MYCTKIDDFFSQLFKGLGENFSLATLGILFTGIIIGFVLCGTIYGLLVIISAKNDQPNKTTSINESSYSDEDMKKLVKDIKKRYLEQTDGFSSSEKMKILSSTLWETINIIAGTYYPESKYPLYELNAEEMLKLIHYLSDRVEMIFDKPILRPLRRMSISQIFRFLDTKRRIEETKIVKAADKMKVGKISRFIGVALNYANPIYWFKKLFVGGTISFAVNKIALIVIDIVADETNNTYSKRIFDKEISTLHQEIEDALDELEENNEYKQ